LNPDAHQPGEWQIEIYLDDQLLASETVQVLADQSELATSSSDQPLIVGHPIVKKQYFASVDHYSTTVSMLVDRDGKVTAVTRGLEDQTIFDYLARDAASMFMFPPDPSRPDKGKEYQQRFDFVLQDSYPE
ncbi:MAG: hypothetical protein PF630_12620, partial [Gammaproteobacteria bacterium]|nr:hypothetical protein [Gammaproteobacteria bacterium]